MDTEQPLSGASGANDKGTAGWELGLRAAREIVIRDFERRYIEWLVSHAGGNMSRAARIARVDRTTLYRLIEKHGMDRKPILSSSPSPLDRVNYLP
jgi:DNA-binding NtrC family response regulator